MENSDYSFVSVIIPVFNDAERLQICLKALAEQTYPQSQYEAIVIDNDSDDADQVRAVVAEFEFAIATQESTPGSYAARNKGLSIAKGSIIAFTDSDCIPAPNWLEQGVHHLSHSPNCGQVIGKVDLFFKDPQKPTPVELYESMTAFPQEKLLKNFHGGATANVFTWRSVIEKVGPFNTQLKSNGDLEWGRRVFEAGYQQIYVADVEVKHPARQGWKQLHQRTIRLAGGVYDLHVRSKNSFLARQRMFARLLLDDLTPPVNFMINAFRTSQLNHWQHRIAVSLVIFYVRYISAWEKMRLNLGGISLRG